MGSSHGGYRYANDYWREAAPLIEPADGHVHDNLWKLPLLCNIRDLRENLKKAISFYVNTYTGRIAPVFNSVDEEAAEKADSYLDEAGSSFDPDRHDAADFAERAWNTGMSIGRE